MTRTGPPIDVPPPGANSAHLFGRARCKSCNCRLTFRFVGTHSTFDLRLLAEATSSSDQSDKRRYLQHRPPDVDARLVVPNLPMASHGPNGSGWSDIGGGRGPASVSFRYITATLV
jgi:hypothetical protein